MEHKEILIRIEEKVLHLGETKRGLEQQISRLKEEMTSLYKINKELLLTVEELNEKNRELESNQSLQPAAQEDFRASAKLRINELVREIDDCIALLNK